jgi:hypothetical protein
MHSYFNSLLEGFKYTIPIRIIGSKNGRFKESTFSILVLIKTMETFLVFKVSFLTFAPPYKNHERQNYSKSNPTLLETWFQKRYYG